MLKFLNINLLASWILKCNVQNTKMFYTFRHMKRILRIEVNDFRNMVYYLEC